MNDIVQSKRIDANSMYRSSTNLAICIATIIPSSTRDLKRIEKLISRTYFLTMSKMLAVGTSTTQDSPEESLSDIFSELAVKSASD